ncbi:PHP C-terminal domain protein [Magnetococcus marinus MC-1]|uniref:protein-tyrosine-phosphatase n=1 Tax=Magnetococcus marinus (strain ATCC BAA-1437 / JCM 17883 / MC-1) TaxID=156889 RepID=A0L9J4_MAGMM|nr:CpsB/CapC family capsule biosynthesis tyrosine phosphatase [Magnetococcus marinus]ABK44637.1 PHP C-terminal domain protein [Magnetococcus marinus MC-1]
MQQSFPLTGYIDLHAHILPGLDDGASTMQMALDMARMAVADGITCMVATPHLNPLSAWNNSAEVVRRALDTLRTHLNKAQIPLQVEGAAELRLTTKTLQQLQSGYAPLLSHGPGPCRYALIEFAHTGLQGAELFMTELLLHRGYTPVIAHPERIRTFRENPDRLEPFIKLGCLTQITASAICGSYGDGVIQLVDGWMEKGWVHLIASDAHNIHRRQPAMRDAGRLLAAQFGHEAAQQLLITHPQAVLQGQPLG